MTHRERGRIGRRADLASRPSPRMAQAPRLRARHPAARKVIGRAVKLAYGVVDDHILQGQKAAERLRAGTYSSADFDSDLQDVARSRAQAFKGARRGGGRLFRRGSEDGRAPLGRPARLGRGRRGEIEAAQPGEVRYSIEPGPLQPGGSPALFRRPNQGAARGHPLYEFGDDQRPVLVVNIPDNHPLRRLQWSDRRFQNARAGGLHQRPDPRRNEVARAGARRSAFRHGDLTARSRAPRGVPARSSGAP